MARVPVDKYIQLLELKKTAAGSGQGPANWLNSTAFEGLAVLVTGKQPVGG
jgi:hypothetical protein